MFVRHLKTVVSRSSCTDVHSLPRYTTKLVCLSIYCNLLTVLHISVARRYGGCRCTLGAKTHNSWRGSSMYGGVCTFSV